MWVGLGNRLNQGGDIRWITRHGYDDDDDDDDGDDDDDDDVFCFVTGPEA